LVPLPLSSPIGYWVEQLPVLNTKGEVIAIHGMTDEGMAKLEEGLSLNALDKDSSTDDESLSPSFLNWGISTQLFTKDFDALPTIADVVDQRFATAEQLIKNAYVFVALNMPEVALALLAEAETLDANNAELWFVKGGALSSLKRYDDAIVAYDQATTIKQDYIEAWNDRGNALSDLNRYDDALASYDKAVEIDPNYAKAWSNRGVTWLTIRLCLRRIVLNHVSIHLIAAYRSL
ncbi:MAG: tetratricopeptide repeat protein, partial [Thainema sp.]